MFDDTLYPDNKDRRGRVAQLGHDCSRLVIQLSKDKIEIEELIREVNEYILKSALRVQEPSGNYKAATCKDVLSIPSTLSTSSTSGANVNVPDVSSVDFVDVSCVTDTGVEWSCFVAEVVSPILLSNPVKNGIAAACKASRRMLGIAADRTYRLDTGFDYQSLPSDVSEAVVLRKPISFQDIPEIRERVSIELSAPDPIYGDLKKIEDLRIEYNDDVYTYQIAREEVQRTNGKFNTDKELERSYEVMVETSKRLKEAQQAWIGKYGSVIDAPEVYNEMVKDCQNLYEATARTKLLRTKLSDATKELARVQKAVDDSWWASTEAKVTVEQWEKIVSDIAKELELREREVGSAIDNIKVTLADINDALSRRIIRNAPNINSNWYIGRLIYSEARLRLARGEYSSKAIKFSELSDKYRSGACSDEEFALAEKDIKIARERCDEFERDVVEASNDAAADQLKIDVNTRLTPDQSKSIEYKAEQLRSDATTKCAKDISKLPETLDQLDLLSSDVSHIASEVEPLPVPRPFPESIELVRLDSIDNELPTRLIADPLIPKSESQPSGYVKLEDGRVLQPETSLLPDWVPVKQMIDTGAMFAMMVAIDVVCGSIDGAVSKVKLQNNIHDLVSHRIELKRCAMVNYHTKTTLKAIPGYYDIIKTLPDITRAQIDKLLADMVNANADITNHITNDIAKAELVKCDTNRNSWVREDW